MMKTRIAIVVMFPDDVFLVNIIAKSTSGAGLLKRQVTKIVVQVSFLKVWNEAARA